MATTPEEARAQVAALLGANPNRLCHSGDEEGAPVILDSWTKLEYVVDDVWIRLKQLRPKATFITPSYTNALQLLNTMLVAERQHFKNGGATGGERNVKAQTRAYYVMDGNWARVQLTTSPQPTPT